MKKRILSIIVAVSIILCLCSCGKDNNESIDNSSFSEKNDTVSVSSSQKLETREDYLNALYGYYETDEAYVYISKDYYEEKSKIEEYDYRYGDVDAINVSMGDNNITTYEISVYRQFIVYYVFDGTQLKTSNGSTAKKITKEVYDKIPLKTYTYTPPVSSETQSNETIVETEPDYIVPVSKAKVGDIIYFGTYEQDGYTNNGLEKIEWRVLEKKNGRLFVISNRVLDRQPYNKDEIHTNYPPETTWEKCSLRTWLNNNFYNTAFSNSEKKKIPSVSIHTDRYRNPTGGYNTNDKIFCLSIEEAATYLKTTENAMTYATRKVLIDNDDVTLAQIETGVINPDNITYSYWLRTPGNYGNSFAMHIELDGEVNFDGNEVNAGRWGVRPAMYININ